MALETMDLHEVRSAMEGILFAAGEPVNIDRICLALELDKPTAEQVLQELGDYYAFERLRSESPQSSLSPRWRC